MAAPDRITITHQRPMTPALCFQARPREGGRLRRLRVRPEQRQGAGLGDANRTGIGMALPPGDFTAWSVRRRPAMDGRASTGTAWWSPEDVPQDAGIALVDLWIDE